MKEMGEELFSLPPELLPVGQALRRRGWTVERCAALLASVDERAETRAPVVALRQMVRDDGVTGRSDDLERALIALAAEAARARLAELRLYDPVRALLAKDLDRLAAPPRAPQSTLDAESYAFAAAAKVATLRRFPAGPLDWEMHGLRRSTLAHVPWRDLPRVLACVAFECRGLTPAFFLHVALPPRNRALVLARDVRLAHYRIARTLAMQPEVKGIFAEAWFLDPAAVRDNAHLAWLNEPYVECGGVRTTAGMAPQDSGFLDRNENRKRAFEAGALQYRFGIGLWPRAAALRWADSHPEWDGL
jgi:hypothetical protein